MNMYYTTFEQNDQKKAHEIKYEHTEDCVLKIENHKKTKDKLKNCCK